MQVAKDDAGNVCTCDLGNAEVCLGYICHRDTVNKGDDGDTPRVLIALIEPLENVVYAETADDRDREEQNGLEDDHPDVGVGVLCTQDKCEDYDADDIVDDRGAYDGRSDGSVELAQLLESCDRDAYGSCGHYCSDEKCLKELFASERVKAVEAHEKDGSEDYGDKNAGTCDGGSLEARLLELLHVSCETCLEHEHDDADLRHLGDEVCLAYKA